jgi:hypothetical protein
MYDTGDSELQGRLLHPFACRRNVQNLRNTSDLGMMILQARTNNVNYNNPVANFNAGNFGRIVSARDPRIMQFAIKYLF